jgi:CheY-like chemotaxis protein
VDNKYYCKFCKKDSLTLEKDNLRKYDKGIIYAYEKDKISRAEELAIANTELDYQQKEKADRADELVILKNELNKNNKEKELVSKKNLLLCIDDNQKNIELVKQVLNLKRPNLEVISSLFGTDTLKLAIQHQPDLILLDLNLGDIHGSEVVKVLLNNSNTKNIPIIIMSADGTPTQIVNNLNLGAKKYLTKPLDLAVLIATIDEWIGKKTN